MARTVVTGTCGSCCDENQTNDRESALIFIGAVDDRAESVAGLWLAASGLTLVAILMASERYGRYAIVPLNMYLEGAVSTNDDHHRGRG